MEDAMPQIFTLSESAVLLQWSNSVSIDINSQVHAVAGFIKEQAVKSIADIIPAYSSLTLVFDLVIFMAGGDATGSLGDFVKKLIAPLFPLEKEWINKQATIMNIPVCYDEQLGNDLDRLAAQHDIPVQEIVHMHAASPYYVYMLGFLPGFAYMGEVSERIAFKRKEKPVPVKAGAVAVAGRQTGIYPVDSPGGWNILGYTPLRVFDASRSSPCLIEPGTTVCFNPIDIETYYRMKNQDAA